MLAQKNELTNFMYFSQIKSSIYEELFQFFINFNSIFKKFCFVVQCFRLFYVLKKFAMVYMILFLKLCIILYKFRNWLLDF